MQDEIMLARSCLLAGDETTQTSMSSVIRLLDQTYQRLLCDENNSDKDSNVTHNNLSRSSSKDKNIIKEEATEKLKHDKKVTSNPQPDLSNAKVNKLLNGTSPSLNKASINDIASSSLQNEVSSTSSSSIISSSLSTSQTHHEMEHVSNKKVRKL